MEIKMATRKKIIDTPREHTTSDLYFAAYCQASGTTFLRTERHGPKVTFVFVADKVEPLVNSWFNGSGLVSGQGYANAIKNLKHLVAGRD
jgi:hypothetical protein